MTSIRIQSNRDISKLMGLYFTTSNYPKCKSSVGDANHVSKFFSVFGVLHYEIGEVRLHDMRKYWKKIPCDHIPLHDWA